MRYAEISLPMGDRLARLGPDKLAGFALVVALHGAAFYGAWSYRRPAAPATVAPVFVSFIDPPSTREETPRLAAPKPLPLEKPRPVEAPPPVEMPQPQQLAAAAPVVAAAEQVVAPPAPVAAPAPVEAPPPVTVAAAAAKPAGPVSLGEELSLSCPERMPPIYPAVAKRRGQTGLVVLRVELDESGKVAHTQVANSSGSNLLDEAAQAAVRQWQCQPARRGGQPVRAMALQPFAFTL